MSLYDENICNILSNKIKANNDNPYTNSLLKIIFFIMNNLKDIVLKGIIIKSIKKNTTLIKIIINLIILYFASNYFILHHMIKYFYSIEEMIYHKLFLLFIHLVNNDKLIFICIVFIIMILIKRIIMKIKIREDYKNKKKRTEKIFIFKYLIKSKAKEKVIRDFNYISLLIDKFLIIINIYQQINNNEIKFKYSKITLKIKGTGENAILGNLTNCYFRSINYLMEVHINGDKQDRIEYKYNFNQTINFVELILDDNLNNCECMFAGCNEITEINFSKFNTSQITNMYCMFLKCTSLTSLDLSNFNTSQVISMNGLFAFCLSLTSLDLSNFNTSQVRDMAGMFFECNSLTSLNLYNFDFSKIYSMNMMFSGCNYLEYINLYNLDIDRFASYNDIFLYVNINIVNIVICLNKDINIESIICYTIDCSNDWKSKQKKIINVSQNCTKSCDMTDQYKYEYNGKCLESCPNGYLYDDNNNKLNICKCELDKCLTCSQVALNKNLCTKCNINYYPKENDPLNLGDYFNCYNETEEGYYLDIKNKIYRKCYYTCKTCNKGGNKITHNCFECKHEFSLDINFNNYSNCYKKCDYYYYFDEEYNYHCTMNYSCPKEYPNLINNKAECIKYGHIDFMKNFLLNYEANITETSQEEEIKYYDNILQYIEDEFTSGKYNTINIDNGQDDIIKTGKIITTLTTSENQKNNINNNMTRIDSGECKILLRYLYNISINESLYIKKIDIYQEGMNTLKVEYNVYAKFFGNKLQKLNLTVCQDNKISISIPIILTDNMDKYNISSEYYNDICYTTTSEDGTDILLKDRQKEYINKDKIVCQEDCDFSEYDYDTFVAKCSCKVKECSESFGDMNINKNKLLDNFKNIKNIINFNFLKCYNKLFIKEGFLNNIGCFILLAIIFFHILTIFKFLIRQFSSIINKINNILNLSQLSEYPLINKNKKREKIVKRKTHLNKDKKISIHKNNRKK